MFGPWLILGIVFFGWVFGVVYTNTGEPKKDRRMVTILLVGLLVAMISNATVIFMNAPLPLFILTGMSLGTIELALAAYNFREYQKRENRVLGVTWLLTAIAVFVSMYLQ